MAAETTSVPWWRFWRRDSSLENPSTDLVEALTGGLADGDLTPAGIRVSPERSLRLISVYACVRVLSEACASLPAPIYRRDGRSRIRVPEDARWELLNDEPNPEMYAKELLELWFGNANLWGSGYLYAPRDERGEVAELWPLASSRTRRVRAKSGELLYETILDSGEPRLLHRSEVVELRAFMGLSPIEKVARDEIATGLAAVEYGGRFWANSARPDGIIQVPGSMDDTQFAEFKARWQAGHQGLRRSHLVGILTANAQWKDIGIPPEAAQFLETRKYTGRQIAALYRVPPYKLGDLDPGSVSYASVEVQNINFVVDSLRPWLVAAEQALRARVFNSVKDRRVGLYPEFLVEGLLRGDTLARYRAYAIGIQHGFLSRAEVREHENLPFEEGLDEFLVPANMVSAEEASAEEMAEQVARAARDLGLDEQTAFALQQLLTERLALEPSSNGTGR